MEHKTLPLYHSSQEELYTIAEIGWDTCLERIKDFSAVKAKYTPAYIKEQQDAIPAARDLGTSQARTAGTEMAHTPLASLAEDCLDCYNFLGIYIDDAFAHNDQKAAHEAAGSAYYSKAANNNWMSLRNLNSAALLFIENNEETLSQGGNNMPGTFQQKYIDAAQKFDTQYMTFVKTNQKDPAATEQKIIANNAIYTSLMAMFKDAAAIYRRDDTVKSYFTYDDILAHITGDKTTGIRFEAIEEITELPVSGVSITAQPGNTSATTAEDGVVKMELPEKTYTLTIIVPAAYQPVPSLSVKTTTGIMHRKKFIVKKLG